MRLAPAHLALSVLMLSAPALADNIVLTTADGDGEDTFLRRLDTGDYSNQPNIALKKQFEDETNGNDRLGLLRFDTSSFAGVGPITDVTLKLQTSGNLSTGNNGNSFLGGHVVHLYGVPDGHAQEDWNPATLTYANFAFTTGEGGHHARPGVDVAINGVDDTLAILLGSFTFPDEPTYQPIGLDLAFSTVPLTQFLASDTNGVVSFILASMTDGPGQVPVVHSAESTTAGATIPTLVINTVGGADPVTPEPASVALLGAGATAALLRRRRVAPFTR